MKIIIFVIIIINIITTSCTTSDKETEKYKKYYESEKKQFQLTKYFMRENLVNEVNSKIVSGLVEYFKVYFNDKNFPVKEEYYNHGFRWYKVLHYNKLNDNFILKNVAIYDKNNNLLRENIYEKNKIVSVVKYIYEKDYKIREEHYINDKANGWWSYFNPNGIAYKKEFYKNGKIDNYWLYYYDKENKLLKEENYDSKNKLIHKYSFN